MTNDGKKTLTYALPNSIEKQDYQRHNKPLPGKPTSILMSTLDDSSRRHVSKLLNCWLLDHDMSIKPWSDVLFAIVLNLYEKAVSNSTTEIGNNKHIWLQTLSTNFPNESRFLMNVYHGKEVATDELSIDFPISGTIRMYGITDETTNTKLNELIQALVYLTYCLYLESYVMQDSHVKLIITSPNDTQQKESASKGTTQIDTKEHKTHHNSLSKRSSDLFNWFRKLAPHHHTPNPPSPPSSITHEKTMKRRSNPLNTVGEGIKRGLSLNNIAKRYHHPVSVVIQKEGEQVQQDDIHRFYRLKQKIGQACISTSPECHFPYPVLLNRLEMEEDELSSERRKLALTHMEMDCQTPTSMLPQRRRSSLLSSFSSSKRNSVIDTDTPLPQSITAYSSLRVPELLSESRKGLEHLMLDTHTLKSFKHHQSITLCYTVYPIGCPDRPCLGPLMSKIDYFRYHAPKDAITPIFPNIDQTLGHTIRQWCTSSQSSCQTHMDHQAQFIPHVFAETPSTTRPDPTSKSSESSIMTLSSSLAAYVGKSSRQCSKFHGCSQPLLDHIHSFAHGIGRVNIHISVDATTSFAPDVITAWISCPLCDASTLPTPLNEKTQHFSFAKYLELIFYSSKLSSPQPFCQHTAEKTQLIRCFHCHGTTVKLIYEESTLFELRVPRIQLTSEEPPAHLGFNEFTAPRLDPTALKEWKHTSATQDVDLFFQSVRTHLDLLNHYTKAEGRRKIRQYPATAKLTETELKELDNEIKSLSKRLDADHQNLLSILVDTHVNELNDFRRHFALQSESIIHYLHDWQKTKCQEVTDEIHWESPDYISSKTVHCFPGSSVLVREDEPSSIIAYTLSSNDYIQEILLDDGTEYSEKSSVNHASDSKNPSMPSLSSTDGTSTTEVSTEPPVLMPPRASPPNVLDEYYSSIERKYISPSTGAATETASFRSMMIEVVKSSVSEAQVSNTKKLEELRAKLSPWAKKHQEALEGEKQQLTERTIKPLVAVKDPQETKEVKLASWSYETKDQNKKNISPHIKHRFVHGGAEFTCTVYYAKEFETLRRQCNINQLIIESLSRCQTWTASGGKSKSSFYKTKDDRMVVKEMMNAWNVAEKDAFLKFAPKYFEHMKKSATEPSVLAKIFGFFTIQMQNTLDKKAPLLNLDVMVMEHLFFNQNIIHRFDFKGIQDRHVDESRKQQKDTTLWDGDWIQEYRTRLTVHEQSKATLELAMMNDTEFLAKCNIMDYSLLVGIDQNKREMTVGIVDFIGAYTWYKKIESRSKSTLQPRREVTVVPPEQYKSRFQREVCDYFIPVPGKFDIVAPANTLPSLLI